MLKIFSRKNQINKPPVNKPNSSFGFLCLMALKSLCTREKAGGIFYKDVEHKPITKPPYMYFYRKQFLSLIIILNITTAGFAYSDNEIANAIYRAENSKSHPYGILTHYKTTTPRQACLNTIAHAKRDWNGKGDFIVFLGNRYAPINSDTDNGTNKFWVSNVKYFLNKEAK